MAPTTRSDEARSATPLRVLGVCGSLQASSHNLELLRLASQVAPDHVELTLFERLRELPHFDPDLEQGGTPEPVSAWRAAITRSDALLITCPEYGHSLPGVLKNAIDWTIGSGELERKVVAFTASTVAPYRGLLGLQALRQTLAALSARVVGGEPTVRGAQAESALRGLLEALLAELARPIEPLS